MLRRNEIIGTVMVIVMAVLSGVFLTLMLEAILVGSASDAVTFALILAAAIAQAVAFYLQLRNTREAIEYAAGIKAKLETINEFMNEKVKDDGDHA